jgi:hypothetical protein
MGEIGFTYFLGPHLWLWDYGGIITFYSEDDQNPKSILPHGNKILLRQENYRLFHNVSVQATYAPPQYMAVGWAAESDVISKKHTYVRLDK